MIKNKFFFACLVLVFVLSNYNCENAVDWDLKPKVNGKLVVDAILTNEIKRHNIKLSLSYSELNGEAPVVSDAKVKVISVPDTFSFVYIPAAGIYRSILPFGAKKNRPYRLEINWEGEQYMATSKLSKVFPFDKINFNQIGESDTMTVANLGPRYHPVEQSMYEINLDWRHLTSSDSSRAQLFFYVFNTIDVNELFPPSKENVIFPKGTVLIGQKYGLDEAFGAYIRAVVMETEWQGGVFDEASSSVPTNISNGGLGFFSVCGIRRDTMIVR